MIEYINNSKHTVRLVGPDGRVVALTSGQRRVLPEFFERYVAKGYITRFVAGSQPQQAHKRITQTTKRQVLPPPAAATPPPATNVIPPRSDSRVLRRSLGVQRERKEVKKPQRPQKRIARQQPAPQKKQIVGKRLNENATALLHENLKTHQYPISNNIGVGILSYNRGHSLQRLIESIKRNTNLNNTTVFISDDASTDTETCQYLDSLSLDGNFVILRNTQRLGVAGNTNRLLRCLARFNDCLLLNDDVEIIKDGWEYIYQKASSNSGIKHFCMRQLGVYGAKKGDNITFNNIAMTKVPDRPHGAILSYTNDVFDKVGYFDEQFGIYGMEHVDWSSRVSRTGIQPAGFYDLEVSSEYFMIHDEKSAVENREHLLDNAKKIFKNIDVMRGYIAPSPRSSVPIISCVIPCRNAERHGAIATVISGIKAQRFPAIEIIVVEHDTQRQLPIEVTQVNYLLVQSGGRPFNKSLAFNKGVALATAPYLLLHDADLILPGSYTKNAYDMLQVYDACHFGKSVMCLTKDASTTVNISRLVDDKNECERVVGYFEGGSLACRRGTYWLVGAFHEDFWGYGVEDCEFYDRLSNNSKWKEDRKFDFVHMWHGRSNGWMQDHQRNKDIGQKISSAPMAQRIKDRHSMLRNGEYRDIFDTAMKGMV